MSWNVYGSDGQRKYLTRSEIDLFLQCAKSQDPATYSLCWMMAVTGCRISEALSLGEQSIDFEAQQVIILCLKKRHRRVFRAIPLPQDLLSALRKWMSNGTLSREKFWPWCRMTAYRRVCQIMREAGLTGSYASPKGLRHGFAIRAIQSNVPLNLVQRWLGHADIKTTAIYTSATGPEERELASRLWSTKPQKSHSAARVTPKRRNPKLPPAENALPKPATPKSPVNASKPAASVDTQALPTFKAPVPHQRSDSPAAASHSLTLLAVLAALGSAGTAHAQPNAQQLATEAAPVRANLNITPKRLTFSREKRAGSVYIFNQGNVPVTADISLVDRVMLPDGQIRAVADDASDGETQRAVARLNSARDHVVAAPRRITLMPGRGQTVRLRASLPADAQSAEYRSHLTVVTVPPRDAGLTAENAAAREAGQLAIQINAVFGLSIPIILRDGIAQPQASIGGIRLEPGEVAGSAPALALDVNRTGEHSLYGTVQVLTGSGKEEIGIARGVGVYPEINHRHVRLPLLRAPQPGEVLEVLFIDDDAKPGTVLARQSFMVR